MEALKNKITFKMKNGTILILEKEDYDNFLEQIKIDYTINMMKSKPENVYFEKNLHEEKIRTMGQLIISGNLNIDEKKKCLDAIIDLCKKDDKTIISLKAAKEKTELSAVTQK